MVQPTPLASAQFPRDEAAMREAFRVPWTRHAITKLASLSPTCSLRLGEWESAVLGDRIENIQVDRPIYIAGLARSGSTALLECVTSFPQAASHRYRDFPWVFTPYWWNEFLARTPRRATSHRPRVHADGIAVSPESSEALEEPLWLSAFPSPCVEGAIAHWQSTSATERAGNDRVANNRFANFYRRHVQKLLL